MTAATDSAWLQAEATWFLAVDVAAQPPAGGVAALATAASALNGAVASLDADWTAAHPPSAGGVPVLSAGLTGPQTATAAVAAMNAAYNALYGGAGYTSSGAAARLQNDAQQFNAIAARATAGTVTSADIAWLTSEVSYLSNLDTILNASSGLNASMQALSASGMLADAMANDDSAGALAVTNALAAMSNVWNAIYSRGVGTGPANDVLQLQTTIIPDLQSLIPSPSPPYTGPAPFSGGVPIGNLNPALAALARAVVADSTICNGQPNTNVRAFMTAYQAFMSQSGPAPAIYSNAIGSIVNSVLGSSTAPACTSIVTTTPAPIATPAAAAGGTSITTILIGAAAVGAVGWLAWYVTTHRRRPSQPLSPVERRRLAKRRAR